MSGPTRLSIQESRGVSNAVQHGRPVIAAAAFADNPVVYLLAGFRIFGMDAGQTLAERFFFVELGQLSIGQ